MYQMEWKWQNRMILPCKKIGKILSPFHNLVGASSTGFGCCHRHFDQETNKSQKICKKSCSPRSQIKTCFCFISQFDDAIIFSDMSRNLPPYCTSWESRTQGLTNSCFETIWNEIDFPTQIHWTFDEEIWTFRRISFENGVRLARNITIFLGHDSIL